MKMKLYFPFLILITTPALAQNAFPFIVGGNDCSYGLSEALKSRNAIDSFDNIKSEYVKTLSCLDSCYTEKDTSYLSETCVDWDQIKTLIQGKASASSIVSFIFQNSSVKCSVNDIAKAKENGDLSGSYFDPVSDGCAQSQRFDGDGKKINFAEHTYNQMGAMGIQFIQYIRNNEGSGVLKNVMTLRLDARGFHQNKGALYTWNFVGSVGFVGGHTGNGADLAVDASAQFENGVYKTFGKKNCRAVLGAIDQVSTHIYLGPKEAEFSNPTPSNSAKTDPKMAETAIKAAVGFICTSYSKDTDNHGSPSPAVYRLELQGDLLRIAMFQNMYPGQEMAFAYNHAGKQISITGSIHHYKNSYVLKPYIDGTVGVGNYSFPSTSHWQAFNALETSLDVTTGMEGNNWKFGVQGKLNDLYWSGNQNILNLYLGLSAGGYL